MPETLYGVLGVDPGADREAVVRAYREQVKECHPDVSEREDASDRFRRLTTAKEVLTDADERRRYDRLGHRTYVRRHLDPERWETGDTDARRTSARESHGERIGGSAVASTDGGAQTTAGSTSTRRGGYGGTGAAYYRPGQRFHPDAREDSLGTLVDLLRTGWSWLLVHLLLIGCAIATAWTIATYSLSQPLPTVPGIVTAALVVVGTLSLSAMHLVTQLYA